MMFVPGAFSRGFLMTMHIKLDQRTIDDLREIRDRITVVSSYAPNNIGESLDLKVRTVIQWIDRFMQAIETGGTKCKKTHSSSSED
jgi:hypothetical protein